MRRVSIAAIVACVVAAMATVLVLVVRRVQAAPSRASAPTQVAPTSPSAGVAETTRAMGSAAPATSSAKTASPRARDFIGVFVAREAAEVAPLVSGRLATVKYRIGERVSAGEVVATLDGRAQELNVAVARSQSEEARAALAVTRSQHETAAEREARVRALADAGLASGEEIATITGDRHVAKLRVDTARATLTRQRATMALLAREQDETQIRAPFDGVVVARYVDPGINVTSERPILRIVRSGEAIIRFALPEERAREVKLGTAVRALAPGLGLEVTGTVRRISPEVDAAARWFVVEADAEGTTAEVLAGSAADVFLVEPHP